MHWEKEIRVRITIRRVVIAVLAASTIANLTIVGAVFGADSAPPVPTETPVLTAAFSTSTDSGPVVTVETPALTWTPMPGITLTESAAITPTDTFPPTQTPTDRPLGLPCIRKFYWPTYRVVHGDSLSRLAYATDSTVGELMSANCLRDSKIYVGQVLYLPRVMPSGPPFTSTATQTQTASVTPSHTSTDTATNTLTNTPTDTLAPTATDTPSSTLTDTPTTPAAACDHALWVSDVTVPSGTVVLPGTAFTKIWRFQNIGSCTWTTSYTAVYMDGESFGSPAISPLPGNVPPGGRVDIAIDMFAPSAPGRYRGYWMFRNANGKLFGVGLQANEPWWLDIEVSGPTPANGPTVFEKVAGFPLCDDSANLYFEVLPRDPEGIRSVILSYTNGPDSLDEPFMFQKGEVYYYDLGTSTNATVSYSFQVTDGLENVTVSQTYQFSAVCPTIN